MDPEAGTVEVNGEPTGSLELINWEGASGRRSTSVDADGSGGAAGAEIRPGVLNVALTGAERGRLLMDELHWDGARPAANVVQRSLLRLRPGWELAIGEVPILSNLRLDQELTLRSGNVLSSGGVADPGGFLDGSLVSRSTLGATLPVAEAEGRLRIEAEQQISRLTAGHSATIPGSGFPLSLRDEFDTTIRGSEDAATRHETELRLRAAESELAALGFSSQGGEDGARRTWSARLGTGSLLPVSSQATLEITERGVAAAGIPSGYGPAWWHTLRLIEPASYDSVATRGIDGEVGLTYQAQPVGAVLTVTGESLHEVGRQREGALRTSLRTPITPAATSGSLEVTPSYSRRVRLIGSSAEDPGVLGDLERYGGSIGSQGYIVRSIPIAEFFGETLRNRFQVASAPFDDAAYSARLDAAIDGEAGFRPVALLIPSSAEGSLGRSLEREESAVRDYREIDLRVRTSAVNLFGRFGARPTFAWYETDEYRIRTEYSRRRALGVETAPQHESSVSVGADARLFFGSPGEGADAAPEDSLFILPTTSYTWSRGPEQQTSGTLTQEIETDFTWRAARVPDWELPLVEEPISALRHTETVRGTAAWQLVGDAAGSSNLTLVASHSSTLHFGERGEISAGINVGVGREPYGDTDSGSTSFGLQASLSGALRF
jgi:hypothetical protein